MSLLAHLAYAAPRATCQPQEAERICFEVREALRLQDTLGCTWAEALSQAARDPRAAAITLASCEPTD